MNIEKNVITKAQTIIRLEAETLNSLANNIDNIFAKVVHLFLKNKGRLIVTGVGKSALIAQKMVATFNSTGTPSQFLHAVDAIHGDLGMITSEDVIVILSKSGDTREIKALLPFFNKKNIPIVALVSSLDSSLARLSNYVLHIPVTEEADPNQLAPSSSSIAQMAMGDALAFCVAQLKGFSKADFAQLHPGGILGKQLFLTIGDIAKHNPIPKVLPNASIKELIFEISSKRLGATAVVDTNEHLLGIITDGDLRRMLNQTTDFQNNFQTLTAKEIMTVQPKTLPHTALALEAFEIMKANSITQIVVMNGDFYIGIVHLHDIIREGLG